MSEAAQVIEVNRPDGWDASVRGGRAGPAGGRPPLLGRMGRLLADVFPAAPEPPWSRMPAAVVAAAHVVALCVGSVVLLARYAGKPPWEILYAEDGWVFLRGALEHSWGSVLHPYAGYLQLVPRLIAEGVSWLPLRDAAAGFAVIAALVAAGCAVFVFTRAQGMSARWCCGRC